MNKPLMTSVALALVLLAAAVLYGSRETNPEPAPSAAAPIAPQPAPRTKLSSPLPGDSAPSPWAANSAKPSGLAAGGNLPPGASAPVDMRAAGQRQRDLIELKKMHTELAVSMREGRPVDPKKVAEALAKLKQIYGSTVAGVNLDAVITNVEKAQEMQALAMEIQREAGKAGGPDRKVLLAQVDKLKKLQSQLRTDVAAVPKPAPAEAAK